ncbi:replication/maintenance protein RepL [Moorella naiadis]|uniref:replication/maintenance protein RepL n=1 Tax=Moorella naiadis (nom. illeg.) TaxID=3093670 RepID=UPI003D9CB250
MEYLHGNKKVVDVQTGEILNVISVIPEQKDKNYLKVFRLFSEKVIMDLRGNLNGATDTLFWLMNKLQELPPNSEPIIAAYPKEIAKTLGLSERTIRTHLNKLCQHKYISQLYPRQYIYRFNPEYLYRGNLVKYWSQANN